jgi:phosphoribosylaminoimidazole carboxylase
VNDITVWGRNADVLQRGIPVATVAINGGMNAGLLAVRILGTGMPYLTSAMDAYLQGLEGEVLGKVEKLEQLGWEKYEVKKS